MPLRLSPFAAALLAGAAALSPAMAQQGVSTMGQAAAPSVSEILRRSGQPVDARVFMGTNPQLAEPILRKLDEMQPLPPQYRAMQDQPVPNAEALVQALGLPTGPRRTTDLTGRTPAPGEIVEALK